MIGRRVTDRRVASLAEVEKLLRERGGELGYGQQASLDYAKKFAKISKEKADELIEELMKNEKINAWTAIKIVDIMPKYKSQVNAVIAKEKCDLSDKEKDEVLRIIAEAMPKIEENTEKTESKAEEKEEKEGKGKKKESEEKAEKEEKKGGKEKG